MSDQKRAYLIDFDNTLFDTDALKKSISGNFIKRFGRKYLSKFWKIYSDSVSALKYVDIKEICKDASKIIKTGKPEDFENLFLNVNFKKFTFKHSEKLINILKNNGKTLLYSTGDSFYQPIKIKKSGIGKIIGEKNIHILNNKKMALEVMILELKNRGVNQIVVIDDRADFLAKSNKVCPDCITVWFRYGKYSNTRPLERFSINYETKSPEDLVHYLENFIAPVKQNRVRGNISVLEEISQPQVKQLIALTAKDKLIKKFTHDKERFRSAKAFSSWKKRGKKIYVMINPKNKLLGIIWFSKSKAPKEIAEKLNSQKCSYTFAIRNYPPARHKGLAPKFINIVLKDFEISKNKGIWLVTSKKNEQANKLYKNYGFSKIADLKKDQIAYIYRG